MEQKLAPAWDSLYVWRSYLGDLEPFDQGGEGVLYRVEGPTGPNGRKLVFKEYRPDTLSELDVAALERLPTFARGLSPETWSWLYRRAAWPTWIVRSESEDGRPVGVLMPIARARFMAEVSRTSGGLRTVPAKFELLLNGDAFLATVGIAISMRQKLRLLVSVAETLSFMHAHSMVVGDFSCKNLLFALKPIPSCFVLDCDSIQWKGQSALPTGETPEWELPDGEFRGTMAADMYKFGLLVLRMHTGAQHHRSPSRLPPEVPAPLRALVERTLTCGPADRPLATEWLAVLRQAAMVASDVPTAATVTVRAGVRSQPRVVTPVALNGVVRAPVARPADLPTLLPPGPIPDAIVGLLRRVLVRQPATPSFGKLVAMAVGLWVICLAIFAVAVFVLGLDPHHMGSLAEVELFGSFIMVGLGALGLVTTEPR